MKLTLERAIAQRDRAESRERAVRLHNTGLQARVGRLEAIAQAAGLVLARWDELSNEPSPEQLVKAMAALRKAVRG